jgi:Rrf2 family nitric oxide-sensitive transcriptional repressor
MQLTRFSNYALRSLQLAALRAPDLIRVDDVVAVHGLSRPHIVKVVHTLGKAGYLETFQGRGGGFRLARAPETISVADILRITEGPLNLVECFEPETNTCPLIGICRLSQALQRATRAFIGELDALTIADITGNRDQLLARIEPLSQTATREARHAV